MLSALFGRSRRKQQHAAEELMTLLDQKASLVVDEDLVASMGVGRKILYRVIYEMVSRERMFMLTDKSDRMLLMTNTEFNRFLFQRSGRTTPLPALTVGTMRVDAAAMESESDITLCVGEDSDLVLEGSTALIVDLDCFSIDAVDVPLKETVATEVPDHRQSLPERRREPWPVTEDSGRR